MIHCQPSFSRLVQTMMVRRTFVVLLVSFSAFVTTLQADPSSVLGQWKLTVETPNGTTNPILTVNAADAGYSGTYVGPRGSFELKEIKVEGNTFSFPLTITIPIGKMDFQYTGKVEGDTVSGSIGNPQGTIPFVGVRVQ